MSTPPNNLNFSFNNYNEILNNSFNNITSNNNINVSNNNINNFINMENFNNNNINNNNNNYQQTIPITTTTKTTTRKNSNNNNNNSDNDNIPKFLINEIININDEFIELQIDNTHQHNNEPGFIDNQPELYQYRLVSCKYCKEFVHFIELVSHRLRCQQILGKCNKCYNQLKSNEFQQHINQCPMNFSIVRYCENCGTALNSNTALKHTEKVCLETILHLNLSALEDSTNTQLNDEQKLKILKIKNDILSLTKSIKTQQPNEINNNNNSNSNNNNNNNSDKSTINSDNYYYNNNLTQTLPTPIPVPMELHDEYSIHVQPLKFQNINSPTLTSQQQHQKQQQQLKLQIQKRNETMLNDDIKPFTKENDDLTREQINQLKLIIKSTPKIQSKKWALVNQIWYSKWEKGIYGKKEMGEISNHHLLDSINGDGGGAGVEQLLRSDIDEHQDFVVVPLEVWKTFKEVYGGSPDIIRKVNDKGEIDLQIPITLFFIKSSDIKNCLNITKSFAFPNETFYALKKRICKIFHLALNDVELYNYDGGIIGQPLHSFLTVSTIKLYNNQMILVEEKQFPLDSLEPLSVKDPTKSSPSSSSTSSQNRSIPPVLDLNDPKIKELIPKNTDYSPLFKHEITEYITDKGHRYMSIKGLPIFYPMYTYPFLPLLNYSFINFNSGKQIPLEQYYKYKETQNNFDSNIDQFQSFSLGGNSLNDSNQINNNNNNNNNNDNNNNNNNNNNDNLEVNRVINSSEEIISPPLLDLPLSSEPPPPLDLEHQKKKSQMRPPQCKVN